MDTPVEVCEERDVKGLYAKARQAMEDGKPMGFTGVDDPYEPPIEPEITLKGFGATPEDNARIIVKYLEEQGSTPCCSGLTPVCWESSSGG
jgi:adenylylsulfate kinase-like enzyme